MAKERKYGWNGEFPAKEQSGQARIVFNVIKGAKDEMHTGHEWTEIVGNELSTRQDPYRVVLYYILILKGMGCIRTNEYDINAVTRKDDIKHGITVRTAATVEERHSVIDPVPTIEEPATVAE